MPEEQASDMVAEDPIVRFRVNVFRCSMVDQITTSIDERFSQNGQLIKDTAYLDPRRFDEIVLSGVPENSLTKVAKITGVDPLSIKEELCCFAKNFTALSRSILVNLKLLLMTLLPWPLPVRRRAVRSKAVIMKM